MSTFRWSLATCAGVGLVWSLILVAQRNVGFWGTAVGMVFLLISVAALAQADRKRKK
jgi:hypothetical protein